MFDFQFRLRFFFFAAAFRSLDEENDEVGFVVAASGFVAFKVDKNEFKRQKKDDCTLVLTTAMLLCIYISLLLILLSFRYFFFRLTVY